MFRMRRRLIDGMIVGATTGAVVGHYADRQFESMATAQAQQSQIDKEQAQAAQATQVANQGKKDITQELENLANLKQKGILSEEEFQQMKARILSSL
jgi:multidrug resistance efflux pump